MTPGEVISRMRRQAVPRTVWTGDLAVVNSIEAFVLGSGHQLRGACCLLCAQLIGKRKVAIIGLAGLAGDACQCGAVCGDLFLIHAAHFPVDPQVIERALRQGMSCRTYHPAHG
jgi:hypothetical protein